MYGSSFHTLFETLSVCVKAFFVIVPYPGCLHNLERDIRHDYPQLRAWPRLRPGQGRRHPRALRGHAGRARARGAVPLVRYLLRQVRLTKFRGSFHNIRRGHLLVRKIND